MKGILRQHDCSFKILRDVRERERGLNRGEDLPVKERVQSVVDIADIVFDTAQQSLFSMRDIKASRLQSKLIQPQILHEGLINSSNDKNLQEFLPNSKVSADKISGTGTQEAILFGRRDVLYLFVDGSFAFIMVVKPGKALTGVVQGLNSRELALYLHCNSFT